MDKDLQHRFWKAFAASPVIMMKRTASADHAEPMGALLDRDAHHAIWFFTTRSNRIAPGGAAMGQVVTKGHDVFACLSGTLVEESDTALRERHWNNAVEAWFPGGRTDPNIVMLRFDIADAEVWTAATGLKTAYKLMTGRPIDPAEAGEHAVGAV